MHSDNSPRVLFRTFPPDVTLGVFMTGSFILVTLCRLQNSVIQLDGF